MVRSVLLLPCGCLWLAAQDQPATPHKAVLDGKVVNSASGAPVRKASVALFAQVGKPGRNETTDAEGKFEFTDLEPGTYLIAVSHEGFVEPNRSGKLRRERVTVALGEEKRDVVIRITPLSYITGRVADEDGDPVRRVLVEALNYQYTPSGRHLSSTSSGLTNDLGEYRIFDLEPGKYYVRAKSTITYQALRAI